MTPQAEEAATLAIALADNLHNPDRLLSILDRLLALADDLARIGERPIAEMLPADFFSAPVRKPARPTAPRPPPSNVVHLDAARRAALARAL